MMELFYNIAALPKHIDALVTFGLIVIIIKLFRAVILSRINSLAKKTSNNLDDLVVDVIKTPGWPFYITLTLYFTLSLYYSQSRFLVLVSAVLPIVAVYYGIKILNKFINFYIDKYVNKNEEKNEYNTTITLLKKGVSIVLWSVALILIIQNLGYDMSAVITGLGVGGIAIGFALQNILSDIFASFSIYLDKPFELGDYVVLGTDSGHVERIGIKSTRIRTLQGEELIVSNKELTEARVANFKKMEKRRIVFRLGVVYSTPREKLQKVLDIIKTTIEDEDKAELVRTHFIEFGDFSLNFETVYFVHSDEFGVYRDIQQRMNFKIMEEFEKEGIVMAFPTQTIHIENGGKAQD